MNLNYEKFRFKQEFELDLNYEKCMFRIIRSSVGLLQ